MEIFQREPASLELFEEALPLLLLHYRSVAHFKDIEFSPDYETYLKMDELGMLRIYTARDSDKNMLGYAVFFVRKNMHYKESLQAVQDILFIHPEARGFGRRFIPYCEEELKKEVDRLKDFEFRYHSISH